MEFTEPMVECTVCHYRSNGVNEIPHWNCEGDIVGYEEPGSKRYCHPCAKQIFHFLSGAESAVAVVQPAGYYDLPENQSLNESPPPVQRVPLAEPILCGICMHTETTNPWGSCDECYESTKPMIKSLMWQETGHDPEE